MLEAIGESAETHVLQCRKRIAEREPEVRAFLALTEGLASSSAEDVDRRLADGRPVGQLSGATVAIKDLLCLRGVRTTCGSQMLRDWVPPYTATAVQRVIDADGVVIGKTNLDEFGMGSSTEHSAFGPTRNPLDLDRVPGGSSGGSAAAVAAGMSRLALGTDTGGSVRQPASFCGVVGIKPTYGLVSRYGLVAYASSLDQIGTIAGNVRDAAALLEVIAGHDPLDSTSIPAPAPPLVDAVELPVDGFRVGIVSELMGDGIDGDVRGRVAAAADALTEAGVLVEEVSVPAMKWAVSAYYLLAPAEASSNLSRFDGVRYGSRVAGDTTEAMMVATRTNGFGPEVKRRIMLGTFALSAGYQDQYYGKASRLRTVLRAQLDELYGSLHALILPTAPTAAFKLGEKLADPLSMYLGDVCTVPANLAGHPAMSVPFGTGTDRMPIGVQVMAPALGERKMLAVAGALERAMHSR